MRAMMLGLLLGVAVVIVTWWPVLFFTPVGDEPWAAVVSLLYGMVCGFAGVTYMAGRGKR